MTTFNSVFNGTNGTGKRVPYGVTINLPETPQGDRLPLTKLLLFK